jgi:hypothetical protein
MGRLNNSVSTVKGLWKRIKFKEPWDGNSMFSETSIEASATRYNAQEEIFKHVHIFSTIKDTEE